MSFTSVALALAAVLSTGANQSPLQVMPQSQTVEQYVTEYFADQPVMIKIAECESHFRQFDKDGKVLKNPGSSAVGVFQIMSSIHASKADDNLGIDIYSLQGNAAYARYLYDKQGTTPWAASKGCWGKKDKDLAVAK